MVKTRRVVEGGGHVKGTAMESRGDGKASLLVTDTLMHREAFYVCATDSDYHTA